MAPDMSKVQYAIKGRVIRNRERDGKEVALVEGSKKLRVVPAVAEQPPMSIGHGFDDYVLSKTKSLRKGMFSGKLGKITVSAAQTGALVLPSPASSSNTPATMATVNLRFDPHEASSEPPRLGGLTTKIRVSTFFAARPAQEFPNRFTMNPQFESTRGIYETSVPLSSRCVEAAAWTKQFPKPEQERRNSDSSTCSSESDSDLPVQKDNKSYYSSTILVPITLPSSKTWVPSFHSCIVSRIYTLDISLTIHTPGAGVPASSVSLHLPVQVAAKGNQTSRTPLTEAEAAAELADAEVFLRPRMIEVPSQEHIGNSVLATAPASRELPPSYEDFFSQPRPVVEPGRS